MAKIDIRYLTTRPGAAGGLPRHFWQPSKALQAQGWKIRRVPENWKDFAEPGPLKSAAAAAAQALNEELDAHRAALRAALAAPAAAPGPGPAATALPAVAAPPLRTVDALIALYKASPRFRGKRASTQRGYRQCLDIISQWAGELPTRSIGTPRFVTFYETMYEVTPAKANAVMRVARLLFAYGRLQGWHPFNPVEKIGLIDLETCGQLWPRAFVSCSTGPPTGATTAI